MYERISHAVAPELHYMQPILDFNWSVFRSQIVFLFVVFSGKLYLF